MIAAILPVRTLLIAIFMLMAGSGFLSTLISLRLDAEGVNSLFIGLVATAYFLGLTFGSLSVSGLVARVGHIRAFATFVSLFSASTLAYALHQDTALWAALRFVDGFCMAGVFVCLESWLNERAEARTRGSVLAFYMIALYAGQAIGQFLLNLAETRPTVPFMAASVILSMAVIPVAITRIVSPQLEARAPLTMRRLYEVSPLGIVGAAINGLMLGAFYAMGAVYIRRLGMELSEAAIFMSAVILGGVVLQWPIGRLSDRFDRRRVISGTFGAAVIISLLIALFGAPGHALLVLASLFGGLSFALYPLCVAHTNDHLTGDERIGASGGLVLAYSVGAAAGPVAGAAAMHLIGPSGLFVFIALAALAALAFALRRQWVSEPVPEAEQQPYQILPRTTPQSASLDPNVLDEEIEPAAAAGA